MRRVRGLVDEALRMSCICPQENALAGLILGSSQAVVDAVWGVEPNPE